MGDIKEKGKTQKFIAELGESLMKVTEPIMKLLKKYSGRLIILAVTAVALSRNQDSVVQFIQKFQGFFTSGGDMSSLLPSLVKQKRRRTITLKKGSQYRRRR